jgi:3-hydroxy acid dehydrogenase/malonic semialdehyde reductase
VADRCLTAHKESGLTQGGKFATVQLDVSDKTQVAGFFNKIPQDLRDIDILGKVKPILMDQPRLHLYLSDS